MPGHDMMPGVPGAGHLSGRGYWHPGKAEGCVKCEPPAPPQRRQRPTRERHDFERRPDPDGGHRDRICQVCGFGDDNPLHR